MQIPFAFVVFFTFLGLKLGGVVDWSWWWVTSPLWIGAILTGIIITATLVFIAHARRSLNRSIRSMGF